MATARALHDISALISGRLKLPPGRAREIKTDSDPEAAIDPRRSAPRTRAQRRPPAASFTFGTAFRYANPLLPI